MFCSMLLTAFMTEKAERSKKETNTKTVVEKIRRHSRLPAASTLFVEELLTADLNVRRLK